MCIEILLLGYSGRKKSGTGLAREVMGLSFSNRAGTYVECPLHGRNLFRHQDDIEGIHLRLREADVHIPWNPASMYMPFGSSGRRCFDA